MFLVLAALEIPQVGAEAALWAIPAILAAAMMIAWAAESAQFFVAQGFALAILAWLQTLPEFAVEAVLAWNQQVPLLLAGLTGALRLLVGLGWPLIYCTAAFFHQRRGEGALREIRLADEQCIEVMGLLLPLLYALVIWWKASLGLMDAVVLFALYAVYLWVLSRVPPQEAEGADKLPEIPRTIVKARPAARTSAIAAMFVVGGALIYFMAGPFLGSLLTLSAMMGVPSFVFVQWIAPFVSEFPEKVSAFYWARTVEGAPMALMNMVSSNINQWTLLAAMLPVVYSAARGTVSSIPLDSQQELELLMTVGQSAVGMLFLVNMRLVWWEAAALFALWFVQFALSPVPGDAGGVIGLLARHIHWHVTVVYWVWFGVGVAMLVRRPGEAKAFRLFGAMWRSGLGPLSGK